MSTQGADERVVHRILERWAADRPHDRFLTCGERTFTFAELNDRSHSVAAGFAASGVRRGDRVAILSANRIEMVDLYFGLAKLGVIQVPLNAFLKGEFLRYQLADCQASVIAVDSAGLDAVVALLPELPDLRTIVVFDGPASAVRPEVEIVDFQTSLLTCAHEPPAVEIGPADTMSIVYTSGTTGFPKGCVLSHGYYTRVAAVMADALELSESDSIYTTLPLFHGGARMMVLANALRLGVPLTIDPAFSPTGILPRCKEVGATVIVGMGVMGSAMLGLPARPEDRDHSVHTFFMAPMTPEKQAAFQERFGIDVFVETFGQTECVPALAGKRATARNRASCGRAAYDLEVAVLDDDGHPVPDGTVGEICLRPRDRFAMFDGYWNNPQATLTAFTGLWYHTGDNGVKLPDGTFAFADRKKDSLRRRGENVSSIELEAAILTHPKVAECAVHAVPSELAEDDIKACVVLKPDTSVEPEELFDFFRGNLPYFAIPRYVELVPTLPRNAVGRVMKHKLREVAFTDATWDFEKLGFAVARGERRGAAVS
jgi:crotonobetaine/carnitine-CoA ligase